MDAIFDMTAVCTTPGQAASFTHMSTRQLFNLYVTSHVCEHGLVGLHVFV
jgi:hypothetical protein